MELTMATFTYSLLAGSLLLKVTIAEFTPYMFLPRDKGSRCVIGEKACDKIVDNLQSYLVFVLNAQRYRFAKGDSSPMPVATDMLMLENDQTLKEKAQKYAESCVRNYGSPAGCPPPKEEELEGGASVFVNKYKTNSDAEPLDRVPTAVMRWVKHYPEQDSERFVRSFDRTQVEERYHDLAKLLNARAWKVGCGVADYSISHEKFEEIVACFYGSPKLKSGDRLYRIGSTQCSNCPSGTSCVTGGPFGNALCKVNEGSFPAVENSPAIRSSRGLARVKERVMKRHHVSASQPEGSLVWLCDLYTNSGECDTELSCSPRWTINTAEGFKSVKLTGPCVTADVFLQKIYIKGPSCFMFDYTKEGNPNDTSQTTVIGFTIQVNGTSGYSTSEGANNDEDDWRTVKVDIPWSNVEVQVGVILHSHSTSGNEQVVKVQNLEIYSGSCSKLL